MSEEFYEQLSLLPDLLAGHLLLTVSALTVGLAISLPLGIFAARSDKLSAWVLGIAGVIQTIPSLALLALMVALLAGTIGFLPAFIALTLYSILPMLRNTVTGLRGVDASYVEAARAVGMTDQQRLSMVEFPLAFPVIIAGIRTSAVWVVGTATLSTPVGAQSLGNYIFMGLQTRNLTAILFGCVFAAALAIVLDQLLGLVESSARSRNKRGMVVAATSLVIILVAGLTPAIMDLVPKDKMPTTATIVDVTTGEAVEYRLPLAGQELTVGSKPFTEQYILSDLLGDYLRSQGAQVTTAQGMGTTILFDALRNSSIDIYVEYTGTIWAAILKRDVFPPRRILELQVENFLLDEYEVLSVGGLGFENAYALAMPEQRASQLGIHSIADLARHAPELTFGSDDEFFARSEWRDVRDSYGLVPGEKRTMDAAFMYEAAGDGQVDVIPAYTSDGRIAAYNLRILEDPLGRFPPYDAIILLSPEAQKMPELVETLKPLVNSITQEAMREANRLVDLERKSPAEAARWLQENLRKTHVSIE